MDPLRISEIVKAVNGRSINCSDESIVKDMAKQITSIKRGCLFIPSTGTKPVTKKLIERAYKKGAAAVIIPNEIDSSVPQIIVKDTIIAYKRIYKYYRSKLKVPLIGITGSAGKTCTRDMMAIVLQQKFNVCKTVENDNTVIGNIKTLLNISSAHGAAVFEMAVGCRPHGQMSQKADIVRPNIAVITNISTGHIEYLGSKENIMKAKLEITKYFDSSGILIINNDDEYLSKIKDKPFKIIRVSTQGKGDYNAFDIVDNEQEGVEFKCNFKGEPHLFKLNVPGSHFVYSALISIAIGELFGLNIEEIKKGIADFRTFKFRMNILELKDNIRVIVDCYNANLISMKAAIDTLKSFNGSKKIAVLGDILEQGKYSEEIHREIGKYLAGKCDILIAVGKDSKYIFEETKTHTEAYYFETKKEACLYIEKILTKSDVILLKASRDMKLEEIAECLLKKFADL